MRKISSENYRQIEKGKQKKSNPVRCVNRFHLGDSDAEIKGDARIIWSISTVFFLHIVSN
jgi:hypothetical protein